MKNHKLNIFILLVLALIPLITIALPFTKGHDATISANSANLNSKTGIDIFLGNVIITQDTTKIRANKVTTYSNSKQKIIKAIAIGTPAKFQTLPKHSKKIFKASANTIEYFPKLHRVILIGNGKLEQAGNLLESDYIVYNRQSGQLITKSLNKKRTTITLKASKTS